MGHFEVRGLVIASSVSAKSRALNHRTTNLIGKHGEEKRIRFFPRSGGLQGFERRVGDSSTLSSVARPYGLCRLLICTRMSLVRIAPAVAAIVRGLVTFTSMGLGVVRQLLSSLKRYQGQVPFQRFIRGGSAW